MGDPRRGAYAKYINEGVDISEEETFYYWPGEIAGDVIAVLWRSWAQLTLWTEHCPADAERRMPWRKVLNRAMSEANGLRNMAESVWFKAGNKPETLEQWTTASCTNKDVERAMEEDWVDFFKQRAEVIEGLLSFHVTMHAKIHEHLALPRFEKVWGKSMDSTMNGFSAQLEGAVQLCRALAAMFLAHGRKNES